MPLETIEIETGENPCATVLLLHGLGADGRDFVPIAQELDLTGCRSGAFRLPERSGNAGHDQRRLCHASLVRHPGRRA
jgi:predicted esterase